MRAIETIRDALPEAARDIKLNVQSVVSESSLSPAEGGIEGVLPDRAAPADWAPVASGAATSTFVDGSPGAPRFVADGRMLDLQAMTNVERCGRPVPCADDEADVPWRLHAHAPLQGLSGSGRPGPPVYVVVWVARARAPGALLLRARGYGLYGTRRGIDVTIAREAERLRILSWRGL